MPELTNEQLEQLGQMLLSPKRNTSLGPFFITLLLDGFFLGILSMQAFKYFSTFRKDRIYIIALVVAVSVIAVASTILCIVWNWQIFVHNFGLWRTLFSIKYLGWFYPLSCVGTIGVQAFFAYRAFELVKRNYFILVQIGTFMIAAFVAGILVKVRGNQMGNSADPDDKKLQIYIYIWLGGTVAADLSITLTILFMLVKRKTGWKVTDRLITKLVKLTFESQLPPSIAATALMIEYSILKNDTPYVSIPFILLQQKIYAFALFHTLNSRDSLGGNGASGGGVYTFSGYGSDSASVLKYKTNSREENMRPALSASNSQTSRTNPLKFIQVTTETETHVDEIPLDQLSSKGGKDKFTNRQPQAQGVPGTPGTYVDLETGSEGGWDTGSKVSILGMGEGRQGSGKSGHPFSNL